MGRAANLKPRRTFQQKLLHEMKEQGLGVRTLARRVSRSTDPKQVEGVRRRINRYVHDGMTPTPPNRHDIEDALGLERDSLKGDGEDEESRMRRRRFDQNDLLDVLAEAVLDRLERQELKAS